MTDCLTDQELRNLVLDVFLPGAHEKGLAILVDLPENAETDSQAWEKRRAIAEDWYSRLSGLKGDLGFHAVDLVYYPCTASSNADLPEKGTLFQGGPHPATMSETAGPDIFFSELFRSRQMFIALTQYSASAPLKIAAREWGFKAASMPGFSEAMIPALRLDFSSVEKRVNRLKRMLDTATGCDIRFSFRGASETLKVDLRHRTAGASTGRFPDKGIAGNLPSGEAFIVPYEGEKEGCASRTEGCIPVQFDRDIVLYKIRQNRVKRILSENTASAREREKLAREPAAGNVAELGFGVLGDFNLAPTGSILLDEKLGFHIAFGRSDHLGGVVGTEAFTRQDRVIHVDHIYIPACQSDITIDHMTLTDEHTGTTTPIMANGRYLVSWD